MTLSINAAHFGAFADGDDLYVTMLLDNCNAHQAQVVVNRSCRADRMTKEYTRVCKAELVVISTAMYCEDSAEEAVTFKLSLDDSNVTGEAKQMILRWNKELITIDIDSALKK